MPSVRAHLAVSVLLLATNTVTGSEEHRAERLWDHGMQRPLLLPSLTGAPWPAASQASTRTRVRVDTQPGLLYRTL